MAKPYLFREEMPVFRPPAICMRCGAPSQAVDFKTFMWTQGGSVEGFGFIGSLINLVMLLTGTKRFRLPMPLCRRHARQRRWRIRLMRWGLVSLVLLICLGVLVLIHGNNDSDLRALGACSLGCAGALAVVLLFMGGIFSITSIQVGRITNAYITLSRVSPDFISGVHSQRTSYPPDLRRRIAEDLWGECDAYDERDRWKNAVPECPIDVFVVWQVNELNAGQGRTGVMGVYSSPELAVQARQRALSDAGLDEAPSGLCIGRYTVDRDRWIAEAVPRDAWD
jgi:hypothetical protein